MNEQIKTQNVGSKKDYALFDRWFIRVFAVLVALVLVVGLAGLVQNLIFMHSILGGMHM